MAKRRKRSFESVKRTLFERRQQLLSNLGRLTGSASEASSRPVGDRVDDAVTDLEVDSSYAIAEQEVQELRLIDTALENIEDGTYGICEDCGKAIEKPRLKALPYAVLCLKCKEAEEMESAAGGGYY
ncbi:MAG: TraR/DksA family transcriptional regulator [Planctomycetota bacterium]